MPYFPQLTQKSAQQAVTAIFRGLNRAEEIADGEFAREMNLSTREYPMLCPRKPRGMGLSISAAYHGMMEKNGKLVTIEGTAVKYGGTTVGITVSEAAAMLPKRLVGMGAYVLIFPDKKYFNSVDLTDCGSIEAEYESEGDITFSLCRLDGSDFGKVTESREAPENPENGDYWYDTGSTPRQLMMYSSTYGAWQAIQTMYIRISAEGIGESIKAGDTVEISGISIDAYDPEPETRDAGPESHILVYDADADALDALTVTYEPAQKGTGIPHEYNERRFIGQTGCTVYISPTANEGDAETVAADWETAAGTLYGWQYDAIAGKAKKTWEHIASYKHSTDSATISGKKWLSSRDEYTEGGEPSDGAEVVYELATPTEYTLTAETPETTRGTNHIWADAGLTEITYAYYDPDYASAKEQAEGLNGSQYVYDSGEDWITVVGALDENVTQSSGKITVSRKCPDMEFIIESGNRLWGCHYGPDSTGQALNEIYACKLGDFRNWRVYQGISTDSYTVSIGSDGPFTGAAAYGGMPMFFKRDCVHKIYGSVPKNFQVMTTQMPGVQRGSGDSIAIVDGAMYYLSDSGVMAYDGSYPVKVSGALGDTPMGSGRGGALGNRYYLDAQRDNERHLYVYDGRLGIWHEEDTQGVLAFAPMDNDLYMMHEHRINTVNGSAGESEGDIYWFAETGLQGWEQYSRKAIGAADAKYISRFFIRAAMPEESTIKCSVQYESSGKWTEKMNIVNYSGETASRLMPVYPKRCDHMRMRLEGTGEIKVHSIIRTISSGGDGKRG